MVGPGGEQGRKLKSIPVEQPTKYELAINLETAKALGINIPDRFMQRVDVIIRVSRCPLLAHGDIEFVRRTCLLLTPKRTLYICVFHNFTP